MPPYHLDEQTKHRIVNLYRENVSITDIADELGISNMGNIVFSIIWLIVLIIISFWVAGLAAGFYIIILPFTVCIEPLSGLTDLLLHMIQFPRYCAQAMVEGRGFN